MSFSLATKPLHISSKNSVSNVPSCKRVNKAEIEVELLRSFFLAKVLASRHTFREVLRTM